MLGFVRLDLEASIIGVHSWPVTEEATDYLSTVNENLSTVSGLLGICDTGESSPEVVGGCEPAGDVRRSRFALTIQPMQLIQIGEVRQKTVLDMIQEMAARQAAEIEQLKLTAMSRVGKNRVTRSRQRCTSPKRVQ